MQTKSNYISFCSKKKLKNLFNRSTIALKMFGEKMGGACVEVREHSEFLAKTMNVNNNNNSKISCHWLYCSMGQVEQLIFRNTQTKVSFSSKIWKLETLF
jgi:hypothetical protein